MIFSRDISLSPISLSVTLSALMSIARLHVGICLLMIVLAAGCGTPGIPEPPSLELARPVTDLRAVRKGNEVHLTWSVPELTEDHQSFRHAGLTRVCRRVGSPMRACETPVVELPPHPASAHHISSRRRLTKSQLPSPPQETYTDRLLATLQMQSPTSNLTYAVSVLNSYGKSAGLSNQVQIPAAPTLPPPGNLSAHLSAKGVDISWDVVTTSAEFTDVKYEYRVYRRDVATNHDAIAGELPLSSNPSLLDTGFEWEKTYDYRVTVVTVVDRPEGAEQVEGDDSSPVRVVAHDVFPPATPTGLQAVFSGPGQKPFIDLIWAGNSESDLAGYNVYRREGEGQALKINTELVKTPAFRDSDVVPDHEYVYSISAVDARGNESPRSEEAAETVPKDQ
jgi:hypothetical protein